MTRSELEETLRAVEQDGDLPITAYVLRKHINALEERIRHLERRLAELAHLGTGAGAKVMGRE